MSDRELLELAAKAAGLPWDQWIIAGNDHWNPLADDGDALRLAVKLGIQCLYSDFSGNAEARWDRGAHRLDEYGPGDPYAATRRAIVRAAAEIGRNME